MTIPIALFFRRRLILNCLRFVNDRIYKILQIDWLKVVYAQHRRLA